MNRLFLLYFPGYFDGDEIIGIYDDVNELKNVYNRVIADENEEYEFFFNHPYTELTMIEFDRKKKSLWMLICKNYGSMPITDF